jgi:hypothetical protein
LLIAAANVNQSMTSPKSGDLTTAVVLVELDAAPSMPRSFFAERVLVELLNLSEGWMGVTSSISRFCPQTLPVGTPVIGPIVNGHRIIDERVEENKALPVRVEQLAKCGPVAVMTCPREDSRLLQSANPFCPNTICVNVCSFTYSKVDQALKEMIMNARAPEGGMPKIHWKCELCGATMLVDRETFSALYKM